MALYQRDDWRELKPHPAAEVFPLMDDVSLVLMVADMAKRGYDRAFPVILYEEQILDGRNRLRACELAGVEPWFYDFEGDDVEEFVVRANLARRQLVLGQICCAALKMHAVMEERAKERMRQAGRDYHRGSEKGSVNIRNPLEDGDSIHAIPDLAKMFGVGESSLQRCRKAEQEYPVLYEEIAAGRITIGAAWNRMSGAYSRYREKEKGGMVNTKPKPALSPRERDLAGWEEAIEDDLEAFLRVARALFEIRERRLFFDKYGQYNRYLKERWGVPFAAGKSVMVGIDALIMADLEERAER